MIKDELLKRRSFLKFTGCISASLIGTNIASDSPETLDKPNVLFIICDDLYDYVEGMGGHSIRLFLVDPENGTWDGPDVALTAIYNNTKKGNIYNYSVRSKHWRYTLYSNDAEELYDHREDPHEWFDLSGENKYDRIRIKLRDELFKIIGRKS